MTGIDGLGGINPGPGTFGLGDEGGYITEDFLNSDLYDFLPPAASSAILKSMVMNEAWAALEGTDHETFKDFFKDPDVSSEDKQAVAAALYLGENPDATPEDVDAFLRENFNDKGEFVGDADELQKWAENEDNDFTKGAGNPSSDDAQKNMRLAARQAKNGVLNEKTMALINYAMVQYEFVMNMALKVVEMIQRSFQKATS